MQTVFESLIGASVGCAVWSFVRSSCEQPRDKDREEQEGRGQGRPETKDRIEEKERKREKPVAWWEEGMASANGLERIETRKESESRVECIEANRG